MSSEKKVDPEGVSPVISQDEGEHRPKETFGQKLWRHTKTPGSAIQIVIAAALAIAIGMAVTTSVDEVPDAARVIVGIPGTLWLRSLKAVGKLRAPSPRGTPRPLPNQSLLRC
jgi:hypothetical protein